MSRPVGWILPPVWTVPREWVGERCFVICGGESIRPIRKLIPLLKGRVIAIKEGVLVRPNADVLFLGGEKGPEIALPLIPKFTGTYMVVRGKSDQELPATVKRVTRTKHHGHLCDLPRPCVCGPGTGTGGTHVSGYDSGTSAINLAYHFGATEIVLLGYDMQGGRWFAGEWPHPMPFIPEQHFQRHMVPLQAMAEDATRKGIRIVNCSPISRVTAFERQPLEAFL
jgi:hypothetical protein